MCHTYIYSIGPMPKSDEYQFFEQFLKFLELPRWFSPDMSVASPKMGPGATIDTLKTGYPRIQALSQDKE
jgi:hypothetical protein